MDQNYIQNLRYKLQKRIGRLNSVDDGDLFLTTLSQFLRFFNESETYTGIIEALLPKFPNAEDEANRILDNNESLYGESEDESAILGYFVLKGLTSNANNANRLISIGHNYRRVSKFHEAIETVREVFIEPFYEYVDENLDDQRAMMVLLMRYKHRSEWFNRDRLYTLSQIERKGEKSLALDLYSYLYDQGIDFTIEPSSISGEIDLIAAQGTDDPLLLDAKVFDGEGRGKTYIRKGFNQIYTYSNQYNEPFGFLVIYKTCEKDLSFSLKKKGHIPTLTHNHKTFFLIIIDIYPHPKPVSQRSPIKATEITEEDLKEILSENE